MAKTKTRRIYVRSKRRSGRKHMTLPLAVLAGFVPLGVGLWNRKSAPATIAPYVLGSLTGYVPGQGWNMANMTEGGLPIAAGFVAHWIAGKMGINRALGRARVPFIRI